MGVFWRAAAGILMAVVLVLTVKKQEGDLAMLLTMAVCVMAAVTAFFFLEPVLELLHRMETLAGLQSGVLSVLLKITGVGIVTEIVGMICRDSGNNALAGGMQLLGTAVILSLSIPVFEALLELLEQLLGGL